MKGVVSLKNSKSVLKKYSGKITLEQLEQGERIIDALKYIEYLKENGSSSEGSSNYKEIEILKKEVNSDFELIVGEIISEISIVGSNGKRYLKKEYSNLKTLSSISRVHGAKLDDISNRIELIDDMLTEEWLTSLLKELLSEGLEDYVTKEYMQSMIEEIVPNDLDLSKYVKKEELNAFKREVDTKLNSLPKYYVSINEPEDLKVGEIWFKLNK